MTDVKIGAIRDDDGSDSDLDVTVASPSKRSSLTLNSNMDFFQLSRLLRGTVEPSMMYPWLTNLQDDTDDEDTNERDDDGNLLIGSNGTASENNDTPENDEQEEPPKNSILSLYRVDLDYNVAGEVENQISNWEEVQLIDCRGDHIHDVVRAAFEPNSSVGKLQICLEEFDLLVLEALVKGLREQQERRLQPSLTSDPSLVTELILTMEMSTESAHVLWHDGINAVSRRSNSLQAIPFGTAPISTPVALQRLDLSQCEFGADTIAVLAEGISQNCHLVSLKLEHCRLEDGEVAQIVHALEGHPCLSELSLRLNYCETESVRAIADLLSSDKKTKLQRLDIAQQDPGVLDIAELARSLTTNTSLLYLNVKENYVRSDHTVELARALTINTTLQELNLENCDIRQPGWMSFLENLPNMEGLLRLWIKDNPINTSEETIAVTNQALSRALQRNSTIHVIDIFDGGDIPESSQGAKIFRTESSTVSGLASIAGARLSYEASGNRGRP